jgi:hypothetical protein
MMRISFIKIRDIEAGMKEEKQKKRKKRKRKK